MAAVLRSGSHARADAETACALHGIEGFSRGGRIRILVPAKVRVRGRAVQFHVTRGPTDDADATSVAGIPCVTATRALIDIADRVSEKVLRVAVDDARRKGLVRLDRLRERALALGHHRGARRLLRVLAAGAWEQESEGERALAPLLDGVGLKPVWGVWVLSDVRVDAWLEEARLAIEYDDGDHHVLPTDRDHDGARRLRLREAGIECIVVTAGMLRDQPEETAARIAAVYRRRVAELARG